MHYDQQVTEHNATEQETSEHKLWKAGTHVAPCKTKDKATTQYTTTNRSHRHAYFSKPTLILNKTCNLT